MSETGVKIGFAFVMVFILVIAGLIWLPAISDCNARGGELVTNAFDWPVCIAGAAR